MTYSEMQLSNIESFLERYFENAIERNGEIVEYIRKGLVDRIKDMQVIIRSNDHAPAHFHLISKQRNIDVRIGIESIEPLEGEYLSSQDLKILKSFYNTYPKMKDRLIEIYQSIHPAIPTH